MNQASVLKWEVESISDPADRNLKLTHAPLVVAAAMHRFRTMGIHYPSLEMLDVKMVDYELAEQIKHYYSAKLVELSLNGQQLSAFRTRLATIVSGRTDLERNELGILYRIGGFYFEDLDTDYVFNNTKPLLMAPPKLPLESRNFELKPLRRSVRSARHGNIVRYWFADQEHNACCVTVVQNNALLSLMDDIFTWPTVNFNSHANIKSTVGDAASRGVRRYWNLFKFKLSRPI